MTIYIACVTFQKRIRTLFFDEDSDILCDSVVNVHHPKLAVTPTESGTSFLETADTTGAGPSNKAAETQGWRKYYTMPTKYFKVFSSAEDFHSESE